MGGFYAHTKCDAAVFGSVTSVFRQTLDRGCLLSLSGRANKMPVSENTPVLKCDNLVVSARGIAETHGKKVALFVPAAGISRLTLKFGRPDHHPLVSMILGAALSLIGVFGLVELIRAPRGIRYELGMIVIGVIGGSIIFDSLKQRYFLEVHHPAGVRRLVFSKRAELKDIRDFCRQVTGVYKYEIGEDAASLPPA